MDRWLARAGHTGANGSSGHGVQNGTGGVSACCNLIHLLDAEELLQVGDSFFRHTAKVCEVQYAQVHATLTSVLEQKGLSPKVQVFILVRAVEFLRGVYVRVGVT